MKKIINILFILIFISIVIINTAYSKESINSNNKSNTDLYIIENEEKININTKIFMGINIAEVNTKYLSTSNLASGGIGVSLLIPNTELIYFGLNIFYFHNIYDVNNIPFKIKNEKITYDLNLIKLFALSNIPLRFGGGIGISIFQNISAIIENNYNGEQYSVIDDYNSISLYSSSEIICEFVASNNSCIDLTFKWFIPVSDSIKEINNAYVNLSSAKENHLCIFLSYSYLLSL